MKDHIDKDHNRGTVSEVMPRTEICLLAVLMFAAVSELTAEQGSKVAYTVSVGEVIVMRHVGTDFFSGPDLMVRVRRQDPIVLRQVGDLDNDIAEMKRKAATVSRRTSILRKKKAASETVPGDPLTVPQRERLALLAVEMGDTCAKLSVFDCRRCLPYDEREPCPKCAKCEEIRVLREKKKASEIVPGQPLTPHESLELDALERQHHELRRKIESADTERGHLLASITGYTSSITVPKSRKTVHFDHEEVLIVFPGDVLQVAVYDEDVTFHDLYGRAETRLDRRTLDAGELKLRMPNVRHVQLRFNLLGNSR